MESGNVVIANGKIGVIYTIYPKDPENRLYAYGIYLDGEKFILRLPQCVVLDKSLNDYINRHVKRFGKVKVERK